MKALWENTFLSIVLILLSYVISFGHASSLALEAKISSCPMPQLESEINTAYEELISDPNNGKKESGFLMLFEKSLPRYDCRRSFDSEPVPACWLSEDYWKWITLFADLKSLEAKMLFGSEKFRDVLSGESAEAYYDQSKEVEFFLNNPGQFPTYSTGHIIEDSSNYTEMVDGIDSIYKYFNVSTSSHLGNQGQNSYVAENSKDEDIASAWVEGVVGDGKGEKIKLKIEHSGEIHGIFIVNGYCKNMEVWENNNRIKKFQLKINGKLKRYLELNDLMAPQIVFFPSTEIKSGDEIELEIEEIYRGEKYNDTAISELYPLGWF